MTSFADEFGISSEAARKIEERAIWNLRRRQVIRAMRQEYVTKTQAAAHESATDPYRVKSATAFRSDFTSAVEDIVFSKEWGDRREQGQP